MASATHYRDPVRPVNQEVLNGLEMVSVKVYPLPGGVGRRQDSAAYDPRFSTLKGLTPIGDEVVYYEHIATVRHRGTNQFFVAFRETMDAFMARQPDLEKYPEWLMKSQEKQAERSIHIYAVTGRPSATTKTHEEWLAHIVDTSVFDALAYFLAKNDVIDQKVLATLR